MVATTPRPPPLSNRANRKTHNAKLRLPKQTRPSREGSDQSGDMIVTFQAPFATPSLLALPRILAAR